jgi:F0F1-type ATP synthase membrane subunit c/vacuolar-type H+-ATPase subunit K
LLIGLGEIQPMANDQKSAAEAQNPALAVRTRDAALARISRTRRWVIAGAAALTATLAALASALIPGKSLGAKTPGATRTPTAATNASTRTPALPAPADAAQLGLEGPGSAPQAPPSSPQPAAPQPAPAQAPSGGGGAVVSGGS